VGTNESEMRERAAQYKQALLKSSKISTTKITQFLTIIIDNVKTEKKEYLNLKVSELFCED